MAASEPAPLGRRPALESLLSSLPEAALPDTLSQPERDSIAAVWADRARRELGIARAFAAITSFAISSGAPASIQWGAGRAAGEEIGHAALCHAVAQRYAARDLPSPTPPAPTTRASSGPAALRAPLQLITTCCVQETVGAATLEAALHEAEHPLARHALRELLTDEVGHAQLGWAYLASLEPRARAGLGAALPEVLKQARAVWRARIEEAPSAGSQGPPHGCPSKPTLLAASDAAFEDLVVAGFQRAIE